MVVNGRNYTHKGLLYGLVPVYIAEINSDAPYIMERHWSLVPAIIAADFLFGLFVFVSAIKDPMFPIKVTGEI